MIYLQSVLQRYRSELAETLAQLNDDVRKGISRHRLDLFCALVLAVVGMIAVTIAAHQVDPRVFTKEAEDVWFQADVGRVYVNMTDRWSDHYRTKVHPLFSLIASPPVYALMKGLKINPTAAVQFMQALFAAVWIATLFMVLRLMGCRRMDSVIFSSIAATSAAAMFWFAVPETYPLGSWSILMTLGVVLLAQNRSLSPHWYTFVSALSLSFTITNWMAGIIATFVMNQWRRAVQITINALCVVVVLWGIQKFIFPSAGFFLGDREETQFLLLDQTGGPLRIMVAALFHSMVMPTIESINNWGVDHPVWQIMTVQHSTPGSASLWGSFAAIAWAMLLLLGLWSLFTIKQQVRFRVALGLMLLGQLTLHLVYGDETFLYTLHFLPLLVVLTALSTLTRARILALVLAGSLLIGGSINNTIQFQQATHFFETHSPVGHALTLR